MLSTDHVVLRAFRATDVDVVHRTRNDLAVEAASQSGEPRPVGPAAFHARIAAGHPALSSGGTDDIEFAVCRADDPDRAPLGIGGLYGIDRFNGLCELGVTVADPRARGLGLGFDAHLVLIAYAFRTLRMHRVHAHVKADNAAALRTCGRLGMTHEGVLREHRWKDGSFVDLHVYGLLAREWDPALLDWRTTAAGVAP